MRSVAVLGASGFIGTRLVEALHLGAEATVLPVVRRPERLASAARFALDLRVADARDETGLTSALAGASHLVHAVAGDPDTILGSIAPAYRAAAAAGVRRIVVLSTASVHGQSPPEGIDETTPLSATQAIAYNNAKVRAEAAWLALRREGPVEVVLLRPAVVHGPRSFWIAGFADELMESRAVLVDGGLGVCNAIHVDNLVHAIGLSLDSPQADGEAILLRDPEAVSWRDLLAPVARQLGRSFVDMPLAEAERRARRPRSLLAGARRLARHLPRPAAAALKAALVEWRGPPGPPGPSEPELTEERIQLHTCRTRLPIDKARRLLAYEPVIDFAEGMRRSLAWLSFAGYPAEGSRDPRLGPGEP